MHDQSFASIVIVYGLVKMNQHKNGTWGEGRGPGTFSTLCISQGRQARRKQASKRAKKLAEHMDNSITAADATTTLNSGQPRVRTADRQQGNDWNR
jgi:hypothetical protein